MAWQHFFNSAFDAPATLGILLATHNAMEENTPWLTKIAYSIVGALPQITVTAVTVIVGTYLSLDARFDSIEKDQLLQKAHAEEQQKSYNAQLAAFQLQCSATQRDLGDLRARVEVNARDVAKLQTLEDVRHAK